MSQIIRVGPSKFLNLATLGHVEYGSEPDHRPGQREEGREVLVAEAHTAGGRVRLVGDDARELVRLLDGYSDTEEFMAEARRLAAVQLAMDAGYAPDEALGSPGVGPHAPGAAEGVTW